jgi:hypothetical protein
MSLNLGPGDEVAWQSWHFPRLQIVLVPPFFSSPPVLATQIRHVRSLCQIIEQVFRVILLVSSSSMDSRSGLQFHPQISLVSPTVVWARLVSRASLSFSVEWALP